MLDPTASKDAKVIDMESFRIHWTGGRRIVLKRQASPREPAGSKPRGGPVEPEIEALSRIIAALHDRFSLELGPEHRLTLQQIQSALDKDAGLDASARVNTRENVRPTLDPKVEDKIQEIVETNFDLYRRVTDDTNFGQAFKNHLFGEYIRRHRRVEERHTLKESKAPEFKPSLRWNLKEDRKDNRNVTHTALKTIAAFLNTEDGDLLIGVDDDHKVLGIEHDRLGTEDKFMRHLAQAVRNGLGARAGTYIDPRTQAVEGKTVCLAICQRSPEPPSRCTSAGRVLKRCRQATSTFAAVLARFVSAGPTSKSTSLPDLPRSDDRPSTGGSSSPRVRHGETLA